MKRSAFIIKDHKTYVHAEEAWFRFHGKKEGAILFVVIPKGDPNSVKKTLLEVIDESIWEEIVWFKTFSNYKPRTLQLKRRKNKFLNFFLKYREYIYNALDVRNINRLSLKYQDVEQVFSGHKNTQEHLATSLNPTELYLMDSGNFLDKIRSTGFIDYTRASRYKSTKLNKFFFRLTGLKLYNRKKTQLFTVYADGLNVKHTVVKNDQGYKKSLVKKKKQGDDAFFISSPLYTFSKKITIDGYIEYLKTIFNSLQINYANVVYIPNPIREKKKDVEEIVNKLGCKVDDRSIPIEIKVAKCQTLPAMCISPYSTALVNIQHFTQGKLKLYCAWHPEFKYFDKLEILRKSVLEVADGIHFMVIENAPTLFPVGSKKYEGKPLFSNFTEWDKEIS